MKKRGVCIDEVVLEDVFDSPNVAWLHNLHLNASPPIHILISALTHVISQFNRQHSLLVENIVDMPWTIMDAPFVKSYIEFMGILVSAKTEFLSLVLASTIQRMTYLSGLNVLSVFHWKPQLPLSLAAWSTTGYLQKSRTTQVVYIAIRYSSPIIEQPISPLCPRPVPHPQLPPNQDQNHRFCSLITLIKSWIPSSPSIHTDSFDHVCLWTRYIGIWRAWLLMRIARMRMTRLL